MIDSCLAIIRLKPQLLLKNGLNQTIEIQLLI